MRTLPVLLLAAGIVASLSSCATAPFSQGCDATVAAGPASSVITATGPLGSAPTVDFPTPSVTKKVERSVLITGTGPELATGDAVVLQWTMLNGATGKVGSQSDYSTNQDPITLGESTIPAVTEGLQCVTVGSRVAIATSASDAGLDPAQFSPSVVFVIDVVDAYPSKAWGVPQAPQAGIPSVVTAPNGAPGVTVPRQDPPATLTVNTLRQADGKKLSENDHAIVKLTSLVWSDSTVFHSTWTPKNQAVSLTLTPSGAVTKGLVDGLIGQRVGSQVIIVVPPDLGFGADGFTGFKGFPSVPADSTLVYVVDILGVVD